MIARSHKPGDAYSRAHGKPHDHDSQHVHDLRSYGYGGRACHTVKLTYYKQIRCAVKSLQKVRYQVRQRKINDVSQYAACGQSCGIYIYSTNLSI